MRGREFLMKDAYSFDVDHEAARRAYDNMFLAYLRTFKRMGLTAIPMQAETGPIGGNMSHEFQILAQTGESAVFYDAAFEQIDFADPDLDTERAQVALRRGRRQARPGGLPGPGRPPALAAAASRSATSSTSAPSTPRPWVPPSWPPDGTEVPVEMGSYGIGVSRLVGALIEAFHDEKGIVWPESVAPFRIGLVNLRPDDAATTALAEDLYGRLHALGVDGADGRPRRAGRASSSRPWS